jgi:hypothetical protein
MPYLFCEKHGREHEADTRKNQEHYRHEGESVLVVKGRLISGPWLCDKCNTPLRKDMYACLFAVYASWMTEGGDEYDFSHESQYFAMERAALTVYGAPWPASLGIRPDRKT